MIKFWYLDECNEPHSLPLEDLGVYVLKNGEPQKLVAHEEPVIGSVVSTVFLAHNLDFMSLRPILFETFARFESADQTHREHIDRYCTWDEALAGHVKWCNKIIDLALEGDNA